MGFDSMKEEYLSLWMHSQQRLRIDATTDVTIVGVAQNGFLLAESPDGDVLELMPDGNSLDMMQGMLLRRH